jgi:hypothetical protein
MCTDAYRAALIRELSSAASTSTPAPSQRPATEPDREVVARQPLPHHPDLGSDDPAGLGAAVASVLAERGPTMVLVEDAMTVSTKIIYQP